MVQIRRGYEYICNLMAVSSCFVNRSALQMANNFSLGSAGHEKYYYQNSNAT